MLIVDLIKHATDVMLRVIELGVLEHVTSSVINDLPMEHIDRMKYELERSTAIGMVAIKNRIDFDQWPVTGPVNKVGLFDKAYSNSIKHAADCECEDCAFIAHILKELPNGRR